MNYSTDSELDIMTALLASKVYGFLPYECGHVGNGRKLYDYGDDAPNYKLLRQYLATQIRLHIPFQTLMDNKVCYMLRLTDFSFVGLYFHDNYMYVGEPPTYRRR